MTTLPPFTREEFLDHLAANRRLTVPELEQWLAELDLVPIVCDGGPRCGHSKCRGWRLEPREFVEESGA